MRLIDADYILSNLNVFSDREHGNEHFLSGIETAQETVKDAPTIEPRPQWIPVAERMPQEHQIVVGWTKDNPFSRYREEVVTWNGKGWVFVYAQRYVTNVKYWMPLPKPYKPEGLENPE